MHLFKFRGDGDTYGGVVRVEGPESLRVYWNGDASTDRWAVYHGDDRVSPWHTTRDSVRKHLKSLVGVFNKPETGRGMPSVASPGQGLANYGHPHVVMSTSATGARKEKKLAQYALIPVDALEELAKVFGYGAEKYSENEWRQGMPWSWNLSAVFRHIAAFQKGEKVDPESGLHPLAHAMAHLTMLHTYDTQGLGEDDRMVHSVTHKSASAQGTDSKDWSFDE